MYFKPETGETFKTHSEIRSASPNVLYPEVMDDGMLAHNGVFPLAYAPPEVGPTQTARPIDPQMVDGAWTQMWSVEDATQEELDERAAAAKAQVPQQVTMRQARLALLQNGMLAGVDAAIDALPSPQNEAARIEWNYARDVERDSPMVGIMSGALALTDDDLDDLFILAATL